MGARFPTYRVGDQVIAPGHTGWEVQRVIRVIRRWGVWRYGITGTDLLLYDHQLFPPHQAAELQARLRGPQTKE